MDCVFKTKSETQNRFSIGNMPGYGRLFFNKGTFVTQDKELVRKLLNHSLKKRGEYHLVTNEELVADYLDGKEPEKLTREILEGVKREGIKELGKLLLAESGNPSIIKEEVLGEPITNSVRDILSFYEIKEKEETTEPKQVKKSPGRPKKTN